MKCIFSVDVEDWFHILDLPSTPPLCQWDSLPSHVERNFLTLLDVFSEKKTRVTCFFLGWVAQRFPHLVKRADELGHEIASHGYAHRLSYEMARSEFRADVVKSKHVIEDLVGHPVYGYRASGFSVTEDTPWFFEELIRAGYRYDSSVFPAARGHGGLPSHSKAPYLVSTDLGSLVELPVTVTDVLGKEVCLFGGGYLRFFPLALIRRMGHRVLREGRPVIFYIHPREIDPDQPRLPMNWRRAFKSYVNLSGTELKVRRLLDEFEMTTFWDFLSLQQGAFWQSPGSGSRVKRRVAVAPPQ